MIKRFTGLCLCLCMLSLGLGCAKEPAAAPEDAEAPAAGIPNPVAEQPNAAALASFGYGIDAPENATNVRYSIISDKIAQVQFTLSEREYTYRAADEAEGDISGVYETFDEEAFAMETDADGWYSSVTVRSIKGGEGGALASFAYPPRQYTLFTPDAITAEEMGGIASALAERVCPREGEPAGE